MSIYCPCIYIYGCDIIYVRIYTLPVLHILFPLFVSVYETVINEIGRAHIIKDGRGSGWQSKTASKKNNLLDTRDVYEIRVSVNNVKQGMVFKSVLVILRSIVLSGYSVKNFIFEISKYIICLSSYQEIEIHYSFEQKIHQFTTLLYYLKKKKLILCLRHTFWTMVF